MNLTIIDFWNLSRVHLQKVIIQYKYFLEKPKKITLNRLNVLFVKVNYQKKTNRFFLTIVQLELVQNVTALEK